MSDLRHWLERVDDRFMGSPVPIQPHDGILLALSIAAGEVHYCQEQIRRLSESETFENPTTVVTNGEYGDTVTTDSEVVSRWVTLRDNAADHMAKYSKMASDMQIDAKQIELAQGTAQQIVSVITKVLTDLGHDLLDSETRSIVRKRLLEGATIEGNATDIPGLIGNG
jgi:hypothetical protein